MADQGTMGNGRSGLPSFRNELSLGNILVLIALIGGLTAFLLRYENRLTVVEALLPSITVQMQSEIKRLDDKITLARDVARIRDGVDDLIERNRTER